MNPCAAGMAKWSGYLRPGGFRFNGLHLRLEGDASRWVAANGGVQAMWDAYFAACRVLTKFIEVDTSALLVW